MFKVTVKKTFNKLSAADVGLNSQIAKHFNIIGKELVNGARASMDKAKTGIKYPSLPRRSSAAGEALANQTGKVKTSINYVLRGNIMDFGSSSEIAAIWEGESSNKFKNRPTLSNQVRAKAPLLRSRLARQAKLTTKINR